MNIRKFATITLLVFSSFAANTVAPSKAELESMYDKAFREFNANNFPQALKELDAIDARQPDLAESQNLRGVILMRQAQYDPAEAALQKALATDPKFWNARFNLAEIPFLRKDWPEARKRFQGLLDGNASELQGEASQLIQYKILLTYLLEGKENMVDSMLAKFELSPDTPAVHYANAAISLNRKNDKEAKDWLTAAEKNFSPQLNKLFAESLYEVGWLEKPAGQNRAAIELTSAADRAAKAKAISKSKFDQAEQAFQQRDLTAARKLVDEADAADPNQPTIINLRGEILLAQKDFDGAENAFKQAAKIDPKFHEAQYNLAQIPFKKKEYGKARDRYEALFSATPAPNGDKDQASQLIKFKIYLTLLLEGKDSRAQKMMEQFQFTGETPALYYAQAAWEFKHNNTAKANDWVTSARKIYSPAMNMVFADAFYDIGWLQNMAAAPVPATTEVAKVESTPSIEPSPIPGTAVASSKSSKQIAAAPQQKPPVSVANVPGMEATTANAVQSPSASQSLVAKNEKNLSAPVAPVSPNAEPSVAANALPSETRAPLPSKSEKTAASVSQPDRATAQSNPPSVASAASATPATVLAPATVQEWSKPSVSEAIDRFNSRTLLVGALLLAGIILLAWVVISELRRRVNVSIFRTGAAPATGPSFQAVERKVTSEKMAAPSRILGGPRQVSLQLKASEPSVRRAAVPFGKSNRPFGTAAGVGAVVENFVPRESAIEQPPAMERPAVEAPPWVTPYQAPEVPVPAVSDFVPSSSPAFTSHEVEVFSDEETPIFVEPPVTAEPAESLETSAEPAPTPFEEFSAPIVAPAEIVAEPEIAIAPEISEPEMEPVAQGQPIPYQVPAFSSALPMSEITKPEPDAKPADLPPEVIAGAAIAGIGALRHSVESPSFAPKVISTEPLAQQPTTPATMPPPTPPTPAPAIRTTPMTGGAPQPQPAGGGMHTAVQLTLSFEISSLQLTPSFKMGALQLKPTSKIVTMRLAPSQQPQPAMNLQVTFEIATVQLAGNSLGMIRLTPSQQQRPGVIGSPSFNIAGLQLLSGADSGAVQMTPSQQGQASVHVTGRFQISTIEFSPSFEIASIVLNSTSKQVSVQLPGAGPSALEGAPVFEITNVQLGANGEIGMMQLNPQGAGPKPV